MSKFKRVLSKRVSWRDILKVSVAVLLVFGCVFGAIAIFGGSKDTISYGKFSIGALDDRGEYVDDKTAIFTEELIECQGLEIAPKVKCTSTYKVFLYDHNKQLVEATESLAGIYKLTDATVQYCRIMIMPEFEDEDATISIWDIPGIVRQYEMSVNKKQNFVVESFFEKDKADKVASYDASTNVLAYVAKDGYGASKLVDISELNGLEISFASAQPKELEIVFYAETDVSDSVVYEHVTTVVTDTGSTVITVDIPEGATHMVINYVLGEQFTVTEAEE